MIGGKVYHGVTTERLRELLQQPGIAMGEDHGTA
jgi:hypothetical protein